jgi:hypothetical protein
MKPGLTALIAEGSEESVQGGLMLDVYKEGQADSHSDFGLKGVETQRAQILVRSRFILHFRAQEVRAKIAKLGAFLACSLLLTLPCISRFSGNEVRDRDFVSFTASGHACASMASRDAKMKPGLTALIAEGSVESVHP